MIERVLIVFLDGVGLGEADPEINPLAEADMPAIRSLLDGRRPVRAHGGFSTRHATLLPLDAQLGVPGLPQSGTGQTAILTGVNAPALLGRHYGPYPNQPLRNLLSNGNLFRQLLASSKPVAFANAYPARYFEAVVRGRRLHGAIPHAAQAAGLSLRTAEDRPPDTH